MINDFDRSLVHTALDNALDNVENFDKWSVEDIVNDLIEYTIDDTIAKEDIAVYVHEWKNKFYTQADSGQSNIETLITFLEGLKDLIDSGHSEVQSICLYLREVHGASISVEAKYLDPLFKSWPKFSGDDSYPVPDPYKGSYSNCTPKEIFWRHFKNRTLWFGEYGKLRYELLVYIIEGLKQKLVELNQKVEENSQSDSYNQSGDVFTFDPRKI